MLSLNLNMILYTHNILIIMVSYQFLEAGWQSLDGSIPLIIVWQGQAVMPMLA